MNCNLILYKNPNIVSKMIDNDYLLIPIVKDTMDMNNIFGISEVGTFIWDNIDGETTIKDLIKKVVSEYEIEKKIASNDVYEFITDCFNNNILIQKHFGKQ
ncbi:MAG: hypothetical protein A2046_03185 [Bacteroidetes bacterium GWA2_30_7]|nr:MAG: hypothetical protein A2046_03185 [Bacteroidetes bacterium GWA2_30_7]